MRAGWIGLAVVGLAVSACGSSVTPTASVGSPAPSASTKTCTVPQPLPDLCVGRAATAQEEQGMVAVGRSGAEADLKLKDWSNCTAGEGCFKVNSPSLAMVGTNAGAFGAITGQYPGGGLGSFCVVFVFSDASGWHYSNVSCAQNPGYMPGPADHVTVSSGCANVRTGPSTWWLASPTTRRSRSTAPPCSPTATSGGIWRDAAGWRTTSWPCRRAASTARDDTSQLAALASLPDGGKGGIRTLEGVSHPLPA